MSEGMVADYVSTLRNLGNDIRALANITADQKKRALSIMPPENIEQVERVRVIRPVVEGQRDLLRTSRTSAERASKPLAGWRKRLVSGGGRPNHGHTGDSKSKHARIVNV